MAGNWIPGVGGLSPGEVAGGAADATGDVVQTGADAGDYVVGGAADTFEGAADWTLGGTADAASNAGRFFGESVIGVSETAGRTAGSGVSALVGGLTNAGGGGGAPPAGTGGGIGTAKLVLLLAIAGVGAYLLWGAI
jgi:hypothetical protein